jgi:transcriptional regulator with XRE-family HTH domain
VSRATVGSLPRRDLSEFHQATKDGMPWDERLALIKRVFPSCDGDLDWNKAFTRDVEMVGHILQDVLKADQSIASPGRPGPRAKLDPLRAEPVYDRWMGKDPTARPYSLLPFCESFAVLIGDESLRHVSRKTGIPRTQIARLLHDEIAPTGVMMETIAAAFGKRPSYFLEYRIGAIASSIMTKLTGNPDKSVRAYESIYYDDPSST